MCIAERFNSQVANRAPSNQETLNDHEVRAFRVSKRETAREVSYLYSRHLSGPKLCKISPDRRSKAVVLVVEGSPLDNGRANVGKCRGRYFRESSDSSPDE